MYKNIDTMLTSVIKCCLINLNTPSSDKVYLRHTLDSETFYLDIGSLFFGKPTKKWVFLHYKIFKRPDVVVLTLNLGYTLSIDTKSHLLDDFDYVFFLKIQQTIDI